MEANALSNEPGCSDISSSSGSSVDPRANCSGDLSMHDLRTSFTELLIVEDVKKSTTTGLNLSLVKSNEGNVAREDDSKDLDGIKVGISASEECVIKCVTLTDLAKPVVGLFNEENEQKNEEKAQVDDDKTSGAFDIHGCVKSVDHCCSPSMSLPAPSKLVSAMKGSRGKVGIAPRRPSVTWAADVYDPIPTSVSHFPYQHSRNDKKKYGKSKQKGSKSSRSNKRKDKKQSREIINSVPTKSEVLPDNGILIGFSKPRVGDFDVAAATSDPFCGSSFMKKSITNLHFPVTEAK